MTGIAGIAQDSVRVQIAFASPAQRTLLQQFPTFEAMDRLVREGIDIPLAEFLGYLIYWKRDSGAPGYQTIEQLMRHAEEATGILSGVVQFDGTSIVRGPGVNPTNKAVTEWIGESLTLSVLNEIHGLTAADWDRIPVIYAGPRSGNRTLDFRKDVVAASDSEHFVEFEAKGFSATDDAEADAAIRRNVKEIADKKRDTAARNAPASQESPKTLRYGAIAALQTSGPARIWLSDPPSDRNDDPARFRILAREGFLLRWMRLLMPRSRFTTSLAGRYWDLIHLANLEELDGVPLVDVTGDEFTVAPTFRYGREPTGVGAGLSHVIDGGGVGQIGVFGQDSIAFVGVKRDLLSLATNQRFDEIIKYRSSAGSIKKVVHCVVSQNRFRRMGLEDTIPSATTARGGYHRFRAEGLLYFATDGTVFGVMTPISR